MGLDGQVGDFCMSCMMPLEGVPCPRCGGTSRHGAPHQLRPGAVLIGRYLIGNVLGQGGFGITYIGRDLTLDLRVAVKEYFPNGYANRNVEFSNEVTALGTKQAQFLEEGKARFLKEARVLARFCGEPGVVEVRDFFEANGTAYIIMEYLDGEDLRTRVARGPLSADGAFNLARPIMDVLEMIHAEGIVHRDVSPDNIMIVRDGSLRLMDFGAARVIDYSDQRTLSIMLKAGYAPEEQYRVRGVQGPWTDIYALSATLYKAVTGNTPEDALERLQHDDLKWPSELGVPISSVQEEAIRRGMALRAQDRFQSIAEMRSFLQGGDVKSAFYRTAMVGDEPTMQVETSIGAQGLRTASPSDDIGGQPIGREASEFQVSNAYDRDNASRNTVGRKRLGTGFKVAAFIAAICVAVAIAFAIILITTPVNYTLAFDSKGGEAVSAIEATSGKPVEEPSEPVYEGHVFKGWYFDEQLTREATFPLKIDVGESGATVRLYAAWEEIPVSYTVRYLEEGTDTPLIADKVVEGLLLSETSAVTEDAPAVDGYDLVSDSPAELTLTRDEAANKVVFYYRIHEEPVVEAEAPAPAQPTVYYSPQTSYTPPASTGSGSSTNKNNNSSSGSGGAKPVTTIDWDD